MKVNALKNVGLAAGHTASFFVPKDHTKNTKPAHKTSEKRIIAIIPTYKPTGTTLELVKDLLKFEQNIDILVVDDSTPRHEKRSIRVLTSIHMLGIKTRRVMILQTPFNHLKAAALNLALTYIQALPKKPNVVITFDDDVTITKDTISEMVKALYAHPKLGVVCTKSFVKNKNTNILTRLQNFEYHGFNITKIGDNGFLYGPLVMQGMLSAFRYEALKSVKAFRTDMLIEDYEMTVRIKKAGWHTGIAKKAIAWTTVPETWGSLWRQRIRWSYGGLLVMKTHARHAHTIMQDIIGHALFLSLLALIGLSFVLKKSDESSSVLVFTLIALGICHFLFSFLFNIIALVTFSKKDRIDWILKLTIIPEFIYSNVLSFILIGSYLFFLFNVVAEFADKHVPILNVHKKGSRVFKTLGYSKAWGTRI